MVRLFRLLRMQDQFLQIGSILVASLAFSIELSISWYLWLTACILIGAGAFGLNELIDAKDTDTLTWNTIHTNVESLPKRLSYSAIILVFTLGLIASYLAGYLWWGIIMLIVSVFYSLPPIRGKGRFGIDIIMQLLAAWLIPSWAITGNHTDIKGYIWFTIMMIGYNWFICFPYQIADYTADKIAGLRNTHVVLGIRSSINIGIVFGVVALLGFVGGTYFKKLWPYSAFPLYLWTIYYYVLWSRMRDDTIILKSMQQFIIKTFPLSRIYVLILGVILILTRVVYR